MDISKLSSKNAIAALFVVVALSVVVILLPVCCCKCDDVACFLACSISAVHLHRFHMFRVWLWFGLCVGWVTDVCLRHCQQIILGNHVLFDIDLLFDVRFLRNPFFVPDLKPLTGEDPRVRNYVLTDPDAVAFIGQLEGLFKFLIPLFERERRSYVNVGIGCTGGRHRSVAIAGRLQESFAAFGYQVTIAHRDLNKQ